MLELILQIVLAIVCVLLIGAVLLQSKGQGLSMTFGGSGAVYRSRRGAERLVFYATIGLGILYGLVSLVIVMLS